MDNRRKRQLRHIGYSFMAVGLAASMTVSSSATVLAAAINTDAVLSGADETGVSEQAVSTSVESAASGETYTATKAMAEISEATQPATDAQTSEAAKDVIIIKPDMTKASELMPAISKTDASDEAGKAEAGSKDGRGGQVTGEPAATEPRTSEPGTSEPGTSGPAATEPGTSEPGTSEPGTSEPGTSEPGTSEPGTSEPGTSEPGTSEPGTSEPGTSEPGTSEPGTSEPGTSEPGTTEPGTSEPATTEPAGKNPSSGGYYDDLVIPSLPSSFKVSPEEYGAIRAAIVKQAKALEGKVSYFWGGKSTSIGWDSRWGVPQVVTIAGSKSTGTTRNYGLDCSGYVAWVFANAYGTAGIISKIGFNTPEQWANSFAIEWQQVQVGDFLFKTTPYAGVTNHIGVVVDIGEDGTIWVAHCSSSRNGVVITSAHSSGFRYIRRPYLFSGDTAAPSIVNMADLKIPEGIEISGAAAAETVQAVGTRDWLSVDALAADLASIFPDAVFAAAVAEGIWNVYAQMSDESAVRLLADAAADNGFLKASEIAQQFAVSDAGLRELHLDDYGFKDILDMVEKAEITVRSVGPSEYSQPTYSEIKDNADNSEKSSLSMLQEAASKVQSSAEKKAAAEKSGNAGSAAGSANESSKGVLAGIIAGFTTETTAADDEDDAPKLNDAAPLALGEAKAETDMAGAGTAEAGTGSADGGSGSADAVAEAPETGDTAEENAAEAEKAYVPIESIEGIQYLRSARKIDLTNNNIHDLLPLDYYRANTNGAYIYNVSIYYQNEEGLWFEDEEGNVHEDGALRLYFGGGIPGSSEEYLTELFVAGNPLETVPEELPGRLWLDFIEQTKAQEKALTVAAERFASDGGVKEDILGTKDDTVVLDIDYMPVAVLSDGETAKQESGEGKIAKKDD